MNTFSESESDGKSRVYIEDPDWLLKKWVSVAVTLLFLLLGFWILFTWYDARTNPKRACHFWFDHYLKAAGPGAAPSDSATTQILQRFQRLGTNALPYLLSEAFHGQARVWTSPSVQWCNDQLLRIGISLGLPANQAQEQVRGLATQLICRNRPQSYQVLPFLKEFLAGADPTQKQRAIQILSNVSNGDQQVILLLMEACNDLDWSTALVANSALKSYLTSNDEASTAFSAYVTGQDWNAQPKAWISQVASLLQMLGTNVGATAPCLLGWLESQDPDGSYTNSIAGTKEATSFPASVHSLRGIRVRQIVYPRPESGPELTPIAPTYQAVASALVAVGAHFPKTLGYLESAFKSTTNQETRFVLADGILHLEPGYAPALDLMTNLWLNELQLWRWSQASNALWTAHYDLNQLPEPLRFQPAALPQWQALGQKVEPRAPGPSLEDWMRFLGTQQPECEGLPLSQWLAEPQRLRSFQSETVSEMLEGAKALLKSSRTNCIPWLLKWTQTASSEKLAVAGRGFRWLGNEGLVTVPALVELARSENPATRVAAFHCLDQMGLGWDILWPALLPALHDPIPRIRVEAALYLSKRHPEQAKQSGIDACLPPAFRQPESPFNSTRIRIIPMN